MTSARNWRLEVPRWLEVHGDFGGQSSRSYVVGSAEGGEEVVERVVIGDVDRCKVEVEFVVVGVEDVFLPQGGVKEVARGDALWVVIVIAGVGRGDFDER